LSIPKIRQPSKDEQETKAQIVIRVAFTTRRTRVKRREGIEAKTPEKAIS
jgi:hypothetical protein